MIMRAIGWPQLWWLGPPGTQSQQSHRPSEMVPICLRLSLGLLLHLFSVLAFVSLAGPAAPDAATEASHSVAVHLADPLSCLRREEGCHRPQPVSMISHCLDMPDRTTVSQTDCHSSRGK